jgi:hypothetical protein
MTVRARQRAVRLYRGQISSPGRPTVAWREDRVRFWGAINAGSVRGRCRGDRCFAGGRDALVPSRWRSETEPCRVRVGPLLVVSGAREHRHLAGAGCWCSRHRSPARAVTIDGLA